MPKSDLAKKLIKNIKYFNLCVLWIFPIFHWTNSFFTSHCQKIGVRLAH